MSLALISNSIYDHLKAADIADLYVGNIESEVLPNPPQNEHLKLFVLPLPTDTRGLVTPVIEEGLIGVNVRFKNGTGPTAPLLMAEEILDLFFAGLKLDGLRIHVVGSIAAPFDDDGWYTTPVTIKYININ